MRAAKVKYSVMRFKSLELALKELEPFIRSGEHLQTGRPFRLLEGMRSREALANWLICVAINHDYQPNRFSFTSDPTGGDGIIYDAQTEATWKTEHVMVPNRRSLRNVTDTEDYVIEAISLKNDKGETYASGKTLLVFLDTGTAPWFPNKVTQQLPQPLHFDDVWVLGLQGVVENEYLYGVSKLDPELPDAPVWHIRIGTDFDRWSVGRIQ